MNTTRKPGDVITGDDPLKPYYIDYGTKKKPVKYDEYMHYEGAPLGVMKRLVASGEADPEDAQNEAPVIKEMMRIGKGVKGYTLHGYRICGRDDARVSVEGFDITRTMTRAEQTKWGEDFRGADACAVTPRGVHTWWD